MFSPLSVCLLPPPPKVKAVMFSTLSVCLFVCVQDISKLWTDLDEILWAGWVCDKDELIRFS